MFDRIVEKHVDNKKLAVYGHDGVVKRFFVGIRVERAPQGAYPAEYNGKIPVAIYF